MKPILWTLMTMASLEQDDPERPDVGFEPNLDPRLGGLGQDAVLVLVMGDAIRLEGKYKQMCI